MATLKYDYVASYALVQSVVRSGEHRNESIDKEAHICSRSVAAHSHYTLWCIIISNKNKLCGALCTSSPAKPENRNKMRSNCTWPVAAWSKERRGTKCTKLYYFALQRAKGMAVCYCSLSLLLFVSILSASRGVLPLSLVFGPRFLLVHKMFRYNRMDAEWTDR